MLKKLTVICFELASLVFVKLHKVILQFPEHTVTQVSW